LLFPPFLQLRRSIRGDLGQLLRREMLSDTTMIDGEGWMKGIRGDSQS
jgi:hypothetical protein